jgi:hemerythrin superfamily protein
MSYQQKYLKYKEKYIQLKKQIGGKSELEKIKELPAGIMTGLFRNAIFIGPIETPFKVIKLHYNDNLLYEELITKIDNNEHSIAKEELIKNPFINKFVNFMNEIKESQKLDLEEINKLMGKGLILLCKQVGINFANFIRHCSLDDFMSLDDVSMCSNGALVRGSCSFPAFIKSINNINVNNEKIIEFLDLVKSKLTSPDDKLEIVVGSIIPNGMGKINILFAPDTLLPDGVKAEPINYRNIEEHIADIKHNPEKSIYTIRGTFPLNTSGTNKDVLDKILEITKTNNVDFVNKMCGSCFRSMYYLVKNATANFSYEVSPDQKLDPVGDTTDIRQCFKNYRSRG